MNRKMRRNLKKDKNLIKELVAIIEKYLPNLFPMFSKLTDTRNQSYTKYSMKTICITRLFGLCCGLTSMTEATEKFNTDECIKNFELICNEKLDELPYWETIQDVFINLKITELREIQKYIVKTLMRSKMFDKYKFNNCFQLLFDGTGLSNHDYNLNENCLTRKHKDGKISYYKYVLECKLVVGNMVISLDSEFIENEKMLTEKQKQDCETNAFKRMIIRIKENFPKQPFIITGDGLYATTPIIKLCIKNNWRYIFNLKPDRLKELNEMFEDNIKYQNDSSIKGYYLSKGIIWNCIKINCLKFIDKIKGKKKEERTFRYLTNIDVNNYNIKHVIELGRNRWHIENNGFYTQKHKIFYINHMYSRNDNAMKIHYFFIQIAHTIRQLLEKGSLILKNLKWKIKEVSEYLTKTLTSTPSDLNELNTNFQLRFDD